MRQEKHSFAIVFLATCTVVSLWLSCSKEYSYEGGPAIILPTDSLPPTDTNTIGAIRPFTYCAGCDTISGNSPMRWSFQLSGTRFCGTITRGLMTLDGSAFTFFGPSACSVDSGLIIEAYFEPNTFIANRQQVTTKQVAIFYYDNVNDTFALRRRSYLPFSITVENYVHQTREATGHFDGVLVSMKGDTASVKNARFRLWFD